MVTNTCLPMALLAFFLAVLALSVHAYDVRRLALTTRGPLETEILPAAQFSLPLTGKVSRPSYKKFLNARRKRSHIARSPSHTAILARTELASEEYVTDITIGGQSFKVIVDTGSSDTWLIKKGFNCYSLTSYPEPYSNCAFGTSGFDESQSKTFVEYLDKNFNTSYGDGEFLTGIVASETVALAGMTVTKQEIGLVTNTAWIGDNVTSGILGLGYPLSTSVYNGTDPNNDSSTNLAPYNPFFFTAVSKKVVSNPYFSISVNRKSLSQQNDSTYDPNMGYLAFGGIVPVPITHPAVTVPVQGYASSSLDGATAYHFYTIAVEAYIFDGSTRPTVGQDTEAFFDTGTPWNLFPADVALAYNSRFMPPAQQNSTDGVYYVACDATAPDFELQIAGETFRIDPRDQILGSAITNATSGEVMCISGMQSGGASDGLFILGDVFLHNVVTTFNIKSNQITITQRAAY